MAFIVYVFLSMSSFSLIHFQRKHLIEGQSIQPQHDLHSLFHLQCQKTKWECFWRSSVENVRKKTNSSRPCSDAHWRQVLCISETAPVWWFVHLHHREKGAPTGVCCQTLQSIWVARRRSWASFQDWNVGTVQRHRVVFCLWFVTTSEFHQLHVDVLCPRQLQTDYWDLVCHRLAAWKVTQVSLQHIHLPQAQLHTESGKGSLHVCDHMVPALKLGVQMSLFIQELCGDSPSAFLKVADFLT